MKIRRMITGAGLLFLAGALGVFAKVSATDFAGKEPAADTFRQLASESAVPTEKNTAEISSKLESEIAVPEEENAIKISSKLASESAVTAEENAAETSFELASEPAATAEEKIAEAYREYQQTFETLKTEADIEKAGYQLLEEQQFDISLTVFGEEEVRFFPAMDKRYHRMAVFILDKNRQILYKTNELENNRICQWQLEQPETEMVAVTFQDLNRDGLTDIGFITQYKEERAYKIGDVLFQSEEGFYRDYRISDKMNRFGMNKNINCIASFVRDGNSIEYLYTALTLEELLENGFQVEKEQSYFRTFEKLGRLQVVPGTAKLVGNNIFMIYLVDDQGNIVWSFQPMEDYDSLYALKGITGRDVDGDGLKDLVVLAEYSFEGASGEYLQELSCSVYYQRTDGFVKDEEFGDFYTCAPEETLEELVKKIREYWGWMT